MQDGEIRSFGERYCNSLCKKLGGVSLMDFGPSASDRPGQVQNWMGWFGHQQQCRIAVWIEINRIAVSDRLLDAKAFHAHWADGNYGTQIIPGVEACHRGPIPTTAFAGILCVDQFNRSIFRTSAVADAIDGIATFEATLPPAPPENPLAAARRRGKEEAKRTHSNKRPDECS
ncbi:hypothetical protein F8B43_4197 [Methylorubrum populi]|uniref:Uncharacterized protein n=2 Tax=Methylorubrum populi TaxID=223967 RepID=A0A833J1I0_9HYPH|nr:hypothetical protein F8B43_4197 [Methylorubrum populi]